MYLIAVIENIVKIDYIKITVEFSSSVGIVFKIFLDDDTLFIITKPLDEFSFRNTIVICTVFINKECVAAHYEEIETLVPKLNKYLEK